MYNYSNIISPKIVSLTYSPKYFAYTPISEATVLKLFLKPPEFWVPLVSMILL